MTPEEEKKEEAKFDEMEEAIWSSCSVDEELTLSDIHVFPIHVFPRRHPPLVSDICRFL